MPDESERPSRHLAWQACYNTRDLGGLPAAGGRHTRWRSIVRSDYLNRLTEVGRQALLAYGVETVVDLRGDHEIAREPAVPIRDGDRVVDYFHRPLDRFEPEIGALIGRAASRAEVYCIILDHYPDAVAGVMRTIVDARPGGIVVHCQGGKDRTGTIAALLLDLAGVPREIIAVDYAESQERLRPVDVPIQAEARQRGETSFWYRPTVTPDVMTAMLAHVDARYGGVEAYLRAAGLSAGEVAALKARLLG